MMNWQQVKEHYPHKWVIVEAIKARSEGNQWVVEQITVVDVFTEVSKALAVYKQIHQQAPERDYFVVHTDKEFLNIYERHWVGIRAASLNITFINVSRLPRRSQNPNHLSHLNTITWPFLSSGN